MLVALLYISFEDNKQTKLRKMNMNHKKQTNNSTDEWTS